MKIAIIGVDDAAAALARRMNGHELVFGASESIMADTERLVAELDQPVPITALREAVDTAKVVLLALPPSELGEVLEELGPLSGKLVLEGAHSWGALAAADATH